VQHYLFRITLRDDSDAIAGDATVTVRFLQDGLQEWALDLATPAKGKGMTVESVVSGGTAVPFTHHSDRCGSRSGRPPRPASCAASPSNMAASRKPGC
jgi:hypothetical protein